MLAYLYSHWRNRERFRFRFYYPWGGNSFPQCTAHNKHHYNYKYTLQTGDIDIDTGIVQLISLLSRVCYSEPLWLRGLGFWIITLVAVFQRVGIVVGLKDWSVHDRWQFLSSGLQHPARDFVWPQNLAQFPTAVLLPRILLSEWSLVFQLEWLECFQPSLTVRWDVQGVELGIKWAEFLGELHKILYYRWVGSGFVTSYFINFLNAWLVFMLTNSASSLFLYLSLNEWMIL